MEENERFQFGWLDANLFIHALFENDPHMPRCREILGALEEGTGEGWIDPVTVHELTYALPRARPDTFRSRMDTFDYLVRFLVLETVQAVGKEVLIAALRRWADSGVRFGDARLAVLAEHGGRTVCTVNRRDFEGIANTF